MWGQEDDGTVPDRGHPAPHEGLDRHEALLTIPLTSFGPPPIEGPPTAGAEIEGYAFAPDHTLTVAASGTDAASLAFLDAAWTGLVERGWGLHRAVRVDDRGRTISIMTVHPPDEGAAARLLGSMAVLPARLRPDLAEIRILATREEAEALTRTLGEAGFAPSSVIFDAKPEPSSPSDLSAEDWAFLGLLIAVGAFDGKRSITPAEAADRMGADRTYLADRIRILEGRMRNLVVGIFPPPPHGTPEPEPSKEEEAP